MKFERYPKRDAVKDYFLLPNELFSLGLSSGEISVYSYLLRCENRESYISAGPAARPSAER